MQMSTYNTKFGPKSGILVEEEPTPPRVVFKAGIRRFHRQLHMSQMQQV